jgi:hypothetical protein
MGWTRSGRQNGPRRRVLRGIAGLALVSLLAAPAGAEVQRIEEIGVVPIRGSGGRGGARDAALQAALQEAVERVARGFLHEVEPSGADEDVDLEKVLGARLVQYTKRFRVLEDQGARPAMFPEKGATSEYVVVVEVFVDADRVEQRLIDAGLLQRAPGAGEVRLVELELRGLDHYGGLQAVRQLLMEEIGAISAVPLRFERGVAVLEVELPGDDADPAELLDQLASASEPGLILRALEADGQRAVLEVTWEPPAPAESR